MKQVLSAKSMGVYLDEHLILSDHVETIIGKIGKRCGFLNKLKYCLPQSILSNIYNTIILPYLQYCAIVWAWPDQDQIGPDAAAQKWPKFSRHFCMCIRLPHGPHRTTHITFTLRQTKKLIACQGAASLLRNQPTSKHVKN